MGAVKFVNSKTSVVYLIGSLRNEKIPHIAKEILELSKIK